MAIVRTDDKHYKAIADAIREHAGYGEDATMTPADMPNVIPFVKNNGWNIGVDTGREFENEEFWNSFFAIPLSTGNYQYLFAGVGWNDDLFRKIIYPNEKIVITAAKGNNMLFMCNNLNWNSTKIDLSEFCKHFDFSQCTAAEGVFQNAVAQNITVDFSNCTTLKNTFNGNSNGKVDNVTLKVSNKCTTFQGAFDYQNHLTNITFMEGSEIVANISFNKSDKLTHDSLMSIINALSVLPEGTTRTLTLHATSKGLLSDAEKAIITETKGWTLA